jgi:hypothetical protein
MNAAVVPAVHWPMALARAVPSKYEVISASELGTSRAPATPCRAREMTRTSAVGANAHISDVRPKPNSPTRRIRIRPSTSDSDPARRMREPRVIR